MILPLKPLPLACFFLFVLRMNIFSCGNIPVINLCPISTPPSLMNFVIPATPHASPCSFEHNHALSPIQLACLCSYKHFKFIKTSSGCTGRRRRSLVHLVTTDTNSKAFYFVRKKGVTCLVDAWPQFCFSLSISVFV